MLLLENKSQHTDDSSTCGPQHCHVHITKAPELQQFERSIKENYLDNRFQAIMSNVCWFQRLECENFLLFFVMSGSK